MTTVSGMSPIIAKDASVFFDKSKNYIEDGKSYVIAHGGMIQVRQLFGRPWQVKIRRLTPTLRTLARAALNIVLL